MVSSYDHRALNRGGYASVVNGRRAGSSARRSAREYATAASDGPYRFVYWCWLEVAPNLPGAQAPSSDSSGECDAVLGPRSPGPPAWAFTGALVSGPRNSMPHINRQEWYDVYTTRCPPKSTPANRRAFDRTFRIWRKRLVISNRLQLGKCTTCDELKEMRRQSVLPKHKGAAARAQRESVDVVIRDRRADCVVQGLATSY